LIARRVPPAIEHEADSVHARPSSELIRQYLTEVLPGLAERSIQPLPELTPTAYTAKMAKLLIPGCPDSSAMVLAGRTPCLFGIPRVLSSMA